MAVADEEDGGHDGTGWILNNRPEFVPDAALIGEPNSMDIVSVANKGIIVLESPCQGADARVDCDGRHGRDQGRGSHSATA